MNRARVLSGGRRTVVNVVWVLMMIWTMTTLKTKNWWCVTLLASNCDRWILRYCLSTRWIETTG